MEITIDYVFSYYDENTERTIKGLNFSASTKITYRKEYCDKTIVYLDAFASTPNDALALLETKIRNFIDNTNNKSSSKVYWMDN